MRGSGSDFSGSAVAEGRRGAAKYRGGFDNGFGRRSDGLRPECVTAFDRGVFNQHSGLTRSGDSRSIESLGDTGFHGGRGWGIYSGAVNGRSGLGHNRRSIRAIGGAEELGNEWVAPGASHLCLSARSHWVDLVLRQDAPRDTRGRLPGPASGVAQGGSSVGDGYVRLKTGSFYATIFL